jgi:homoserine kinase
VPDRVTVRVPATIANLGPGFDCLGIAIAWHNEVRVERDPGGALTVTAAGHGADEIPRDETNLALRAIAGVLGTSDGLRVHLTNVIPFGRGFGSSAAAIVGGMLAAHVLAGKHVAAASFVRSAAALEGHADNVAPCVFGGAVVVAEEAIMPLGAPPEIEVLVCIAPTALSTEAARKVLPSEVAFGDATENVARASLLVAALAHGDASALLAATEDRLHQVYRFALMPDSGRLVEKLRENGIAAFLAGAGPSVAAVVPTVQAEAHEATARRFAPDGWEVRLLGFDANGAGVVESA